VEFLRAKDDRFLGPLTIAQGTSLVIALVGVAMLARWATDDGATNPRQVAALQPATAR